MNKTVTVIGQGYVGLPLAQAASAAGWKVWGLELDDNKTAALNAGLSHVDDISNTDISRMLANGYAATIDETCIAQSDVVVICVPTPLGDDGAPDLRAVEASTRSVAANLRAKALVILESTTYPGTTEQVCLPILTQGSRLNLDEDFLLAFSPERVDPGRADFHLKNTPKLVGGVTPKSTEAALAFYSDFVDLVIPMKGAKEAETAKLLENTFRHINIALVNEMAKFCHELDIDIWDVIRGASTKPFGFMKFTPGPGVGGHCIPIDPNYLSHEVRKRLGYPFRFVELAQEINHSMPTYVVQRVAELLNEQERAIKGSRIVLLGVTYKPDIADQRESPSAPIAELLIKKGADLAFHDPYVDHWSLPHLSIDRVADLEDAVRCADLVVLLQAHSIYDIPQIEREASMLFDTRGVTEGSSRL